MPQLYAVIAEESINLYTLFECKGQTLRSARTYAACIEKSSEDEVDE